MNDSTHVGKQPKVNRPLSALRGGGVIGIDFGATNLRAAFVSEHGLAHLESRPTPNQGTAQEVWQAISALIKTVIARNNGQLPMAICAGVPSVVDCTTGTVYDVQHVPACKSLPLGDLIKKEYGVLALINNDANTFALGEYYYGNSKTNGSMICYGPNHDPGLQGELGTYEHTDSKPILKKYTGTDNEVALPILNNKNSIKGATLIGLTIGTGLGAGLILNGKLYSGPNCGAGEIGCLPYLDANLEKYVSGAFFNKEGLDGKVYFELAQKKEAHALARYQHFGYHLGQAIKILMYTYDPDCIVLGGSVSRAFGFFEKAMIDAMLDFDYPRILEKIRIYPSSLNHSAILGAASLYFDYVKGM